MTGKLRTIVYVMVGLFIFRKFSKVIMINTLIYVAKTVAYKSYLENSCCDLREGGHTGGSVLSSLITAPGPYYTIHLGPVSRQLKLSTINLHS
jgi:hypothetical protein